MKFRLATILAAGCLLGVSGIANANLIVNGNFETGTLAGWTASGLTCSAVGSNYSSATHCYGYDSDPGPHGGAAALYLGTAAGGGVISQSFATTFGQSYLVDFYLAVGAYNGSTAPNSFKVDVNGNTLFSLLNAPAQSFGHYTYSFAASSSTTTLKFTHGNLPSFFLLDDVSVNAVPEPGTLGLLGLGIAGLGFAKRRRRA